MERPSTRDRQRDGARLNPPETSLGAVARRGKREDDGRVEAMRALPIMGLSIVRRLKGPTNKLY